MRILQILAYDSQDGAYGGPARVAALQCEALARRGHDVTLIHGAPGEKTVRTVHDGYVRIAVPARLLSRRLGFGSLWAPRMTSAARASGPWDVVHVHMARDLAVAVAAWGLRKQPQVHQTHGMIKSSHRTLARIMDTVLVRPSLRRATAVLALTSDETRDLRDVEPLCKTSNIANGVVVSPMPVFGRRQDKVVFISRLQSRKRPVAFVEMAALLREEFPTTQFAIVGPDEGEFDAVTEAINRLGVGDTVTVHPGVSHDRVERLLREAKLLVLPSVDEIFPMIMLEAFSSGTPVVATKSLGIAQECRAYGAAEISDPSARALADAAAVVLRDPDRQGQLREGGRRYLRERLDIDVVVAELEGHYLRAQASVRSRNVERAVESQTEKTE